MFHLKSRCKQCGGTGVSDLHSYNLGSTFFFLGVDLALPIIIVVIPLYILLTFSDLDIFQLLHYWRIVAGICVLVFILSLWFVAPLLKKLLFGCCALCGGSGNAKEQQDE